MGAVAGESEAVGGDFAGGVLAEGRDDGISSGAALGRQRALGFYCVGAGCGARDAGRAVRVQVKGTGRLDRGGYDVQPVHSTRKGGKKRYTKKDIDVIAAYVQPEDAWYLIPIEAVGRAKSLRLYPQGRAGESSNPTLSRNRGEVGHLGRKCARDWEEWRDAWEVLEL